MTADHVVAAGTPLVSIAFFAWNEERAIPTLLKSLFQQSIFADLERRGSKAEIVCVLNGCTDRSAEIADQIFAMRQREHPQRAAVRGRVENISQRGKFNAWNQYVHTISARSARYLFMMDADIVIHPPDTLRNMLLTLEQDSEAAVAVDVPCKDVSFKKGKSLSDHLSVNMARMTAAAEGQLCGQLYCIRAEIARKIYLPRDLPACEDGFIKALVCTDFLEHEVWPHRIKVAPHAAHTFEAYTSPKDIFKNQKRQAIGQTAVHILVDNYLASLPAATRADLPGLLRAADANDPSWLKRLLAEHLLRAKYPSRLYPDLLTQRFKQLANLSPVKRLLCLPAALASATVTLLAAFAAWKNLKKGAIAYWPKAERAGLDSAAASVQPTLAYPTTIPNQN